MKPSWRKPAGAFAILALITLWAGVIVALADWITPWPILAQVAFYIVTGVIWIAPLRPLLRWVEADKRSLDDQADRPLSRRDSNKRRR